MAKSSFEPRKSVLPPRRRAKNESTKRFSNISQLRNGLIRRRWAYTRQRASYVYLPPPARIIVEAREPGALEGLGIFNYIPRQKRIPLVQIGFPNETLSNINYVRRGCCTVTERTYDTYVPYLQETPATL